MKDRYFVYIMTNERQTVLYVGVTNDLAHRVTEHKAQLAPGFTARYNVGKLVFWEDFADPNAAIAREADQGRVTEEEGRADQSHES